MVRDLKAQPSMTPGASEKLRVESSSRLIFLSRTIGKGHDLSVPWSLRLRNRTAAATCGRGRCELPAILKLTPKIASG